MSADETDPRAKLDEALREAKDSLLNRPIDVSLDDLRDAAEAAAKAGNAHAEELAVLVRRLEAAYEVYDHVEHEFLDLFFPEG
jgi:hypothetical protein